jgi:hypothetical protein
MRLPEVVIDGMRRAVNKRQALCLAIYLPERDPRSYQVGALSFAELLACSAVGLICCYALNPAFHQSSCFVHLPCCLTHLPLCFSIFPTGLFTRRALLHLPLMFFAHALLVCAPAP